MRGGRATGTVRHLIRDLGAERLALIDPEEFLCVDPGTTRGAFEARWRTRDPVATQRVLRVASRGWRTRPPPVLRAGAHQRWRTYTKAFLDVAERCGVRRIVSLGALLASAPHTRPIRVTARCTDPRRAIVARRLGHLSSAIPTRARPVFRSVVLDAAERRDMQHVGFMGQAPHYLPRFRESGGDPGADELRGPACFA